MNEACRQLKATVQAASIAAESIVPDIKQRSLVRFGSVVSLASLFHTAPR